MQVLEDRAGRYGKPAPVEFIAQPRRVGGQVAVRAQLDARVAGLSDLVQETLPGNLLWIVGEPHPPAVGCAANHGRLAHRLVLSIGARSGRWAALCAVYAS